ncbi:MAG: polysaccharide biosynthesis/export family protein [Sedimentisphaerales bacterium]|nr:polysaccharide biosynthesis/export family protein [Sedimentisphaerales bacterium]
MSYSQNKVTRVFLLSTIALVSTGCFSSNPRDIQAFLKPRQADVTADKYILQPPDEVEVHCTRVPELNVQRQRIRPDGKIGVEILGEFQAAGKTPEELAAAIQQKTSTLYALIGDKPIEVRVIAFKSKVFYVLGQVYQPGIKLYTGRDSVMSAISDAQPNPMAWLERVQVIRPSDDPKAKAKIFEVNFDRMMAHGELGKNVLLQEGDVIYVPPTVLAALGMKIEEIIRPIARAFAGVYIMQSGGQQYVGGYGNQ